MSDDDAKVNKNVSVYPNLFILMYFLMFTVLKIRWRLPGKPLEVAQKQFGRRESQLISHLLCRKSFFCKQFLGFFNLQGGEIFGRRFAGNQFKFLSEPRITYAKFSRKHVPVYHFRDVLVHVNLALLNFLLCRETNVIGIVGCDEQQSEDVERNSHKTVLKMRELVLCHRQGIQKQLNYFRIQTNVEAAVLLLRICSFYQIEEEIALESDEIFLPSGFSEADNRCAAVRDKAG